MPASKTKSKRTKASTTRKTTTRKRSPKTSGTKRSRHAAIEPDRPGIGSTTPFDPLDRIREEFLLESPEPTGAAVEEIACGIAGLTRIEQPISAQPFPSTSIEGKDGISRKLLARIAAMAAGEIVGLAPPRIDLRTRLEDIFKGRIDGIRVDIGTTEAAVDILTRVRYGADIPELTSLLRETIARRIWEMTGLRVIEVNVTFQDIAPPIEEATIS